MDAVYGISEGKSLEKLIGVDMTSRVVKDVDDYFKVNPGFENEFNHFTPAQWLLLNPAWVCDNQSDLVDALDRFESLFKKLNSFLI